jgi:hypothetical protein
LGAKADAWGNISIGAAVDSFDRHLIGRRTTTRGERFPQEVVIYVFASVILLGVFHRQFARRFGRTGIIAAVSLALALFVCFKAGFVRYDHALIAAGALLIAAYCVTAIVVLAWGYIDRAHSGLDIGLALQRVHNAISNSYNGIMVRVSAPQQLRTAFDQENATTRAQFPLPSVRWDVDLYPYDVSTVFAHGLHWSPRPVFWSRHQRLLIQ